MKRTVLSLVFVLSFFVGLQSAFADNCKKDFEPCNYMQDCCTGVCNSTDGRCGCSKVGERCTYVTDCCSNTTCNRGRCELKPACGQVGDYCDAGRACCPGNICEFSSKTCFKPSCRQTGQSCRMDNQCCSNRCSYKRCR